MGLRSSLSPEWLAELGRQVVAEAYGDPQAGRHYRPDIALINYYEGQARMGMFAFHGVPKTLPGTGDPGIGLDSGRFNITLRESGLD
jgi:alkylated DNA repair protein (DNA oxidative demethylase)